ncbi:DMT family transporter [Bizionia gelidisalsuginis]|uniref:DMT family transporter n=2 Tax=Bizionia TaxID=283785 RepID=A0A8H2LIH8_9FLAO|nr:MULTISPECIES: DMT family transporter [Bizionia]TYB77387.1 DMT family transporter [Bizionia saleffrena]TYC17931.1 DMT family transporter [Bizionia gelidisalsuginis]
MIALIFSILSSTFIFVIFKLFKKYQVNTLHAIVFNYYTACAFGLLHYKTPVNITTILNAKWLIGAIVLGVLFITVFNIMALTVQKNGLSVASVASKMSVVIPIVFGIYLYHEKLGVLKIVGIVFALIAVYLTSIKEKKVVFNSKGLWLPLSLFLGAGIIDTFINYIENTYLEPDSIPIFSATIFCFAGLIGTLLILVKSTKPPLNLSYKSVVGGFFLGVANYYSIHYILLALQSKHLESSIVFTINNVAIVATSTLLGLLLFKEKLITKNWIGIGLALLSIILIVNS